jgi:predicted TIM-barrel fold metal-dependent hydrolase
MPRGEDMSVDHSLYVLDAEPDMPAPFADVAAPRRKGPAGTTDCHMHIFGAPGTVPLHPERGYTPCETSLADYRAMAAVLGIERTVVVQPSVYGTDNGCTREAVEALGSAGRGVAVTDGATPDSELHRLTDAGFRGTRFNMVSGAGVDLDELENMARRIADYGWHLQTFVSGRLLAEIAPRLATLPVDVVVDHMGGPNPAKGMDQPGFTALRDLLGSGKAWVKISGAYRVDSGEAPWPAADAYARSLIETAPERVVWGTDWPHPSLAGPMPNDGALFDRLLDWCAGDDDLLRRIAVDNPARLYGFD